jgi:hypothetical protein
MFPTSEGPTENASASSK